jgi:hypothetical protein
MLRLTQKSLDFELYKNGIWQNMIGFET